jgi:pyruvate,orthophosphate dikinase
VFDADHAEILGRSGEKVILVREETKPEDIHGFFASQGILTSRGGKTSHAAVVARSMGKACVAGAEGITVDTKLRQAMVGDQVLVEGSIITIDGSTGHVYLGEISTIPPEFSDELKILLSWADEVAQLKVMTNADTPDAAKRGVEYGAMGIGLCRTERMFNATDRLPIVVDMILSNTSEEREAALSKLLPIQKQDFIDILKVMSPRPVTVRLLDPPMHEFLPTEHQLLEELEQLRQLRSSVRGMATLFNSMRMSQNYTADTLPKMQVPFNELGEELVNSTISKKEQMLRKVRELYEVNPMLGHRGVRVGITYPEIYAMQIRAILEATAECTKKGITVTPEIMVPQVITAQELRWVKKIVDDLKQEIEAKENVQLNFKFGTMIETVRACMRSPQLAEIAEFFSFGTNDLTQATFSFSREDAENKFLPLYNEKGILQNNPFEVLDTKGVGQLMSMTVEWGRKAHSGLKVGICGEQGGHPGSIRFCHHIDLDYVSCSAPRVPIARLAAAHAKLLEDKYKVD